MASDAFDILGLPPRFNLTEAEIERAWLSKIATTHPDASGDDDAEAASALNTAKDELEDSERRANLVLNRLGGPSAEQDNSLPDGFLMEIFSVREEMESRLASGSDAARDDLQQWASERRAEHIARVGGLFDSADDPEVRLTIRRELNVWRYTERMIEQLDPGYDPNTADFR